MASFKLWLAISATFSLLSHIECGHYLNGDGTPHDMYHELHIPRNQPPYPTYEKIPKTSFSCEGKKWGYHADVESQCQAYHLCQGKLIQSFLCPNATLFHDQFKACDQFYNVRCGVALEDL
ncbi:hypothetical protein RUM44_004135 [Polyplax serrata]|uniref:Chitin-binding type-2 domain-containing protein n=1 Tax=Polyplax serrata TaxID=468196 RepID=A0ABR1B3I9_POLSC